LTETNGFYLIHEMKILNPWFMSLRLLFDLLLLLSPLYYCFSYFLLLPLLQQHLQHIE